MTRELFSGLRATLVAISVISLLVQSAPAVAQLPHINYDDKLQVVELWRRYADSQGNDEARRRDLLRGGERSLEVLVDLLWGPKEMTTPAGLKKIDGLINQLGAGQLNDRDDAVWRLQCMMPGVSPLLEKRRDDANGEIRDRVRALLGDEQAARKDDGLKLSLLLPATAIMERDWPMEELRKVASRNLDRLALVDKVEYHWSRRPIAPLLASLRYSDDRAERQLLADFVRKAKDGAAVTAFTVMQNGLGGRTETISPAWKAKLPPHDYRDAALACLDPERPKVFESATFILRGDARLPDFLHKAVGKIADDDVRDNLYFWLWHDYNDPVARDRFFTMLSSSDDKTFEKAVAWLTSPDHQAEAAAVIPKVSAVLHGDNPKRRLEVLERLGNYFAPEGAALAADDVAPFLVSQEPSEKTAARKTLLRIQDGRNLNVLQHVAEKATDEKVRAEAKQLLTEWEEKQPRRSKH
jgi:hypothetical protein